MKRINKILQQDKLKHFFIGTLISFVIINVAYYFSFEYYGFAICIIGFAAKEIVYDKWLQKGTPEWLDFFYGAVAAILILITKIF